MYERKKGFTILILFVLSYLVMSLLTGVVFAQGDAEPEATAEAVVTETEAVAEVEEPIIEEEAVSVIDPLDTVWVFVAGLFVIFMQSGFALLEAGFVQTKAVVNIFMKNVFDLSLGAIAYWAIGFGVMFGAGNGFFGTEWFFLSDLPEVYPGLTIPSYGFFFFQFAFAATAATIASGAMAGRTDFRGYFVYSIIATIFIYPLVGHWTWGGGWLAEMGFTDFAGSTIVHSTGAWIGLMGAIILGPRLNRFGPNGTPMPGHSMTLAALGTFILWLGWFGFNPGSLLAADPVNIAYIALTTNMGASAGAISAMLLGWFFVGKPQLPWSLNGALAGLVSVTASCDIITPAEALFIGAVGGAVMYFGVGLLERLQVDDVVGAVPVHGFCGIWGTLAVGIFGAEIGLLHGGGFAQLGVQITGIISVGAFVLISAGVVFYALKSLGWLRAEPEAEILGLDIYEHGMVAYPEFTNSPSEPVPFN
jgi:Amt family ammonium transporter